MGKKGYKRLPPFFFLFYLLILEAAGGRNSGLASSSLRQEDWEPSRHTSLGKSLKIFELLRKCWKILRKCRKIFEFRNIKKILEHINKISEILRKSYKVFEILRKDCHGPRPSDSSLRRSTSASASPPSLPIALDSASCCHQIFGSRTFWRNLQFFESLRSLQT